MNLLKNKSYFFEYRTKIKNGTIKANIKIKKILNLIYKNLKNPNNKFYLDLKAGHRPIKFIEKFCKHSKGKWAGTPVKLELWQKAIIEIMYGCLNKKTSFRHFIKIFLVVGRKNGKSLLTAALSLYHLLADGENGGQIILCATKKDQTSEVFDPVKGMIRQSKALSSMVKIVRNQVVYLDQRGLESIIKAIPNDPDTADGLNPSVVIFDEIQAHKTRALYDKMTTALGAREQPMFIGITTAGTVRESIYDDLINLSDLILNESEKLTLLPIIYELDTDKEWINSQNWIKANPNLGVSKFKDKLEEEFLQAKAFQGAKISFLTLHCNRPQTSLDGYVDYADIVKNDGNLDLKTTKGWQVVAGVDLSKTTDLTSITFKLKNPIKNKKWYFHSRGFVSREQFKKLLILDKTPYDRWVANGYIKVIEGTYVDYDWVVEWLKNEIIKYNWNLKAIAIDPYSASQVILKLEKANFKVFPVPPVAKWFNNPMEDFKGRLMAGNVVHNNNSALAYQLGQVVVAYDGAGNQRPAKASKNTQRIDMFVSTLLSVIAFNQEIPKTQAFINYMDKLRQKRKEGII